MEIKFFCPRWGSEKIPWDKFLSSVRDAGYSGIEWFPFGEDSDYDEVLSLLEHYNLDFCIVMGVNKPYTNFKDYVLDFKNHLLGLVQIKNDKKSPLFISTQAGREFFTYDQTVECLEVCVDVQKQFSLPIYQETHRNKWAYAAHVVYPVLQKNESVLLTLDVSHWFCVSESYLEDQQDAVNEAIKRTRHIHARVGFTEGPQVWDPADEEFSEALNAHLKIWDQYVFQMQKMNRDFITITPEFGPPPYLVRGGRVSSMHEEQWRLNLWMKDFLMKRYHHL